MAEDPIITRTLDSVQQLDAQTWNRLLAMQPAPTPFMRHEYLAALETSASAVPQTGWAGHVITLWQGEQLLAACPLYVKGHSYGEYVFDWAWARAYHQHGLDYYPKGVAAVPFTPVPGSRLLVSAAEWRRPLVQAIEAWARQLGLSSLHMLFTDPEDQQACAAQGWMARSTVQFHWLNRNPAAQARAAQGWRDFEDFLASLAQDKRKKIRQERRKVREAGVGFKALHGREITTRDWDFFYRCYERTYLEHGNAPYLTPAFFQAMAEHMPQAWLMFVAERHGRPIASSLVALGTDPSAQAGVAYGRYWGALERVDCLHFEACYYQPIEWCIAQGFARFEGGAQGEHKMARALLPTITPSAHWIAHPAFADAIARFLGQETAGMDSYLHALQAHSPLRQA